MESLISIKNFEEPSTRWDNVYLGAAFLIAMIMFLFNPELFLTAITSMNVLD